MVKIQGTSRQHTGQCWQARMVSGRRFKRFLRNCVKLKYFLWCELFHSKHLSSKWLLTTGPADPPVAAALRLSQSWKPGQSLSLSQTLELPWSRLASVLTLSLFIVHCYYSDLSLRTWISSGVFIANLPLKPCFVSIVILCIHQYLFHYFCELSSGSFSKEINNEQEINK